MSGLPEKFSTSHHSYMFNIFIMSI